MRGLCVFLHDTMPRGETRRLRVDQWSMRRQSVLYSHLSVVTSRLSAVHAWTIRALTVFLPPPTVIYGAYPRSIRAHCVVYQLNIRARSYSGARPQYRVSPGFGNFPPRAHRGSARGFSRHRLSSAKPPPRLKFLVWPGLKKETWLFFLPKTMFLSMPSFPAIFFLFRFI